MGGQHNNTQSNAHHYKGGNFYVSRGCGHGQGCGCFNNNYPCLTNPFPTLYIEQAPESTSPEALSTVTNTNNSKKSNKQTYVLKHFKNQPNRGEKNSQWLHDDVVNCEAVNIEDINCCKTANNKINIARLALTNTKSHHFDLIHFQNSQVENITKQLLEKKNTVYVFDAECIQEVDNFKVYIDIYITQTECLKTLKQDLLPISLLIPKYIQNVPNYKALMALFDSGGTISLIHERVLLTEVKPIISTTQNFTTLAGDFQLNRQVLLKDIVLPEFKRTANIKDNLFQIFIGPCSYDIILGRDFLQKIQFNINFDNNTMNCMDMSVPVRSPDFFSDCTRLRDIMFVDDIEVDSFALMITKSKYQQVSISTIVDAQKHLSVEDKNTLSIMLSKHTILFDGILKVYPHRLVHLDVIQNATPRHLRAYPVAHIHLEVFKAELSRLCEIGVLEICGASQWASPTFIIPKKDGSVRWVSDFRELNKVIQRRIYPLPRIQDILKHRP